MRRITVLGSTGSIGDSTLNVIEQHPDRFSIHALSAYRNWRKLAAQCKRFRPEVAVIGSPEAAIDLAIHLRASGLSTEVMWGINALNTVATTDSCDTVVAAIVGAAGLCSTLAAARAGKRILLANKEALVMSGSLFVMTVQNNGAILLPLDSEHNAIFQCLPGGNARAGGVERLILTASGGPFRTRSVGTLLNVTLDEACRHPNWSMGRKISVDCATMMNKGLEVIEAYWLFGIPSARIEVLLHPQSIIHSMVTYSDGSVIAQLGNPDMRTPIAHALAYPERVSAGVAPLDLVAISQLSFEHADLEKFPCLRLAFEALSTGGSATTILNAANEIAVQAFLDGKIRFVSIAQVVESTLSRANIEKLITFEDILEADAQARCIAKSIAAKNLV